MFKSPRFLFCRFSPLGGSEVQAAVMPPAPGGYDGGFGAPEAVTPFCARFRWAAKLFGVCVAVFCLGVGFALAQSPRFFRLSVYSPGLCVVSVGIGDGAT